MKYVIILGDGMADRPIESLGGKTPLEYASTPTIDLLSERAEIGLLHTIPDGMKPGSDTANLSVLGYAPDKYYSGRSPLEALSIGVPMKDTDIAIRTNIVTITEDPALPFEEQTIVDHSSGEISTEDCTVLLDAVRKEIENEVFRFYAGTSYRHCLIWDTEKDPGLKGEGADRQAAAMNLVEELCPPHDHLGQVIRDYLPKEKAFYQMMEKSYEILKDHPLNQERKKRGENPANCIWFWGAGTKPALSPFEKETGLKGVMISAVDLLKGIAVGSSMKIMEVEGATGGLNTNYEGKAMAAVHALRDEGYDFAYIHVEAPDEMGHQGSVEKKVQAIEELDRRVIKVIYEELTNAGLDFRMAVLPDHPTPIAVRTHTGESVPYLIYDSRKPIGGGIHYNEREAARSQIHLSEGPMLIKRLIE